MSSVIYRSPYPSAPIFMGSISDLLNSSPYITGRENKPVLVDGYSGESLTLGQHVQLVKKLTALLKTKYRLKPGQVIGLFIPNVITLPATHHAIIAAGGVVSPISSSYMQDDVKNQIVEANARYLIALDGHFTKVGEEAVRGTKCELLAFKPFITEAIQTELNVDLGIPVELSQPADKSLAYLCFSSGTTGKFKGVMTSHSNLANNILQAITSDKTIFAPDDVYAGFLPQTHIYALTLHVYLSVYIGATLIVYPEFNFEKFLQSVIKYKITFVHAVPPIMILLAKSPVVDKYKEISISLRTIYCAAAPLSISLANAVQDRLGNGIVVSQGYGLTETSPATHLMPKTRPAEKMGSIGFLLRNIEARLIDEEGKDTPPGRPGELILKGPNIMMGYLNNPQANAVTLTDGWLHTGDVASVDEDGYWYIVDRLKELIKSKGFQVAPAELEAKLLTHPKVIDAAVIAHWSENEASEQPRAFVVLASGGDALEIKKWMDKSVSKPKRLWGGIVVIDQIPKSPSGKILRRLLRDRKNDVIVGASDIKEAAKL
ncbi:hypothetical protein V1514DRAFT_304351 [Lipomyces japonicus]|uniref:uncharacterized protein n=1 Tax=Lipomyces japonicus TaxID=56871 RepID=UPI0034CEF682